MASCVLKISLSDDMIEQVERHKKLRHKQSIEEAVIDLIGYALRLPQFIIEKEDKEAYDVTSDPLYNMGCYDSEDDNEPKENYASNIDSYLYHNGNYPK